MIVISARVEIAPLDIDSYLTSIRKVIAPTRAEKGCRLYAVAPDIDIAETHVVWLFEQWDTEEDLMTHLSSPHILAFLEHAATLSVTDMTVTKYEAISAEPLILS